MPKLNERLGPKPIIIAITTWQVPFEQTVQKIHSVTSEKEAVDFINAESKKWWNANEGDRWVEQSMLEDIQDVTHCIPYQPIEELGYEHARYELWGGEVGFHAMLDNESWWRLHEAHYKREFDDKGLKRPGYLRVAMGEDVSTEIAEIEAVYGDHSKH